MTILEVSADWVSGGKSPGCVINPGKWNKIVLLDYHPPITHAHVIISTSLICCLQIALYWRRPLLKVKGTAKMKWNESGFRPPLCTYRLNWARRTSWGWWDDWDDTVLQTQDSKFKPWRSEAEHATSRSRRLPTILTFTRGWGRNIFVFFKPPRPGTEPRTLAWKAAVLTTTLGPPPKRDCICWQKNKWNEWRFRPPLCTCSLTRAKITSWGCWDEWDDPVLQTQDSKFGTRRSEAEHTISRSRRHNK